MPVSPALTDASIQYPPRLLAEAVRALLDQSPSDDVDGQPCGTLTVQRAWLPVFKLEDQTAIVISVLTGDDQGQLFDRSNRNQLDIQIDLSVQKLLQETDQDSLDWKEEIDGVMDFAQRCLIAAYVGLSDENGNRYTPIRYERTQLDETLRQWNQIAVLFTITYRSVQ